LKSVRKKNSKQSPEEHLEKVNSLQEQLRKEFYQISKLKKEAAIQMLKSDEGQKRLREALKIYYLKLTAEERQELKPLVTATLNWSKELTQTGN
jgi:alanyl-tRNA synthetase